MPPAVTNSSCPPTQQSTMVAQRKQPSSQTDCHSTEDHPGKQDEKLSGQPVAVQSMDLPLPSEHLRPSKRPQQKDQHDAWLRPTGVPSAATQTR